MMANMVKGKGSAKRQAKTDALALCHTNTPHWFLYKYV